MVCADKVRIMQTWHFLFHSIQKKNENFSQPLNFL